MATDSKDFKVKNGLIVANGATFGGTVTVATPTLGGHAATKDYVDNLTSTIIYPVFASAPQNPQEGTIYINSTTDRIEYYYDNEWVVLANFNDTADIKQHIHDTAIGGTGTIVSIFQDAGYYDTQFSSAQDAGYYNFNQWAMTWNGGIAIDNFN